MALPQHQPPYHGVIDLLSDTDDGLGEVAATNNADDAPASSPPQATTTSTAWDWPVDLQKLDHQAGGKYCEVDGHFVFIPNESASPEPGPSRRREVVGQPPSSAVREVTSAEDCLKRVLEIFPDINHDHVNSIYTGFDIAGEYETLPPPARFDAVIEQLMSADTYPKQPKADNKGKKRKRDDDAEDGEFWQWLRPDREVAPSSTKRWALGMLAQDFPHLSQHKIWATLAKERHLFQTYLSLAKTSTPEVEFARSADPGAAHAMGVATGWPQLHDELQAARRRLDQTRSAELMQEAVKMREKENLRIAIEGGETAECQACFDVYPMNRQIHCDGPTAHFTCFECAETYIKTKVGEAACGIICTAGCGASYSPKQLNLLSNKELLAKLAELEQQKAIRDAGLEDLEECCFCEYKAIMPPVAENFVFACQNPECGKVSCRRCRREEHIPHSCEEHAKDNKLSSRHKVEEAMTAALIRSCNKCKKTFIKEYGCNKMTCPSCHNTQCYVCSKDVKDYSHFDRGDGEPSSSSCKLHDDVEARHAREIKEAEATARAEVLRDNPDISEQDLEIKMSEAVEDDRKKARLRHAGQLAQLRAQQQQMAHLRAQRLQQFEQADHIGGVDQVGGADPAGLPALHARRDNLLRQMGLGLDLLGPGGLPNLLLAQEAAARARLYDPAAYALRFLPDHVHAFDPAAAVQAPRHPAPAHAPAYGAVPQAPRPAAVRPAPRPAAIHGRVRPDILPRARAQAPPPPAYPQPPPQEAIYQAARNRRAARRHIPAPPRAAPAHRAQEPRYVRADVAPVQQPAAVDDEFPDLYDEPGLYRPQHQNQH